MASTAFSYARTRNAFGEPSSSTVSWASSRKSATSESLLAAIPWSLSSTQWPGKVRHVWRLPDGFALIGSHDTRSGHPHSQLRGLAFVARRAPCDQEGHRRDSRGQGRLSSGPD